MLFVVVILAAGFLLWWLLPDTWRIKYAMRYMVDLGNITIESKPHDCDWDSAPLGSKHCHYEMIDVAMNAKGQIVDGSHVKVSTDHNQISIDDGETWHDAAADLTSSKVHVGWRRVED